MTLGEFEEIVKICKPLKSELIYIDGNIIYGMDNAITIYIKEMLVETPLPTLGFTDRDWVNIFNDLNNKNINYNNSQ